MKYREIYNMDEKGLEKLSKAFAKKSGVRGADRDDLQNRLLLKLFDSRVKAEELNVPDEEFPRFCGRVMWNEINKFKQNNKMRNGTSYRSKNRVKVINYGIEGDRAAGLADGPNTYPLEGFDEARDFDEETSTEKAQRLAALVLPDERELIHLIYIKGLTTREAAKELGLSRANAQRIKTKAIKRLKRIINADSDV